MKKEYYQMFHFKRKQKKKKQEKQEKHGNRSTTPLLTSEDSDFSWSIQENGRRPTHNRYKG